MDSSDDVTDDLVGLPGFIRRSLLLMRDLDLRFVTYLNDARKKEQVFLSKFPDSAQDAISTSDKTYARNDSVSTPSRSQGADTEKTVSSAKGRSSKSKGASNCKQKATTNESKRHCRSGNASTASAGADHAPVPDPSDDIEEIQRLRTDAMYLAQENLAINDQLTCMLKHEYENLKLVFDKMYREMEVTGQMTDKLRMSFMVNKCKPQMLLDPVLPKADMESPEGGSIALSADAEGASRRSTSSGSVQGSSNSSSQKKDAANKHRDVTTAKTSSS
ncbi:hypothetical protein X943_003118 [Babesia divergens]|uniref:Inhibitor of growth protein N-terminal histone-binding domain-containing protein n=1 Tax=Babesia divergens TaxID=32595 RepID=A0AAD9LGR0_BABDI|nr:hypothetical protein X943_003118 [Babesia divergens]